MSLFNKMSKPEEAKSDLSTSKGNGGEAKSNGNAQEKPNTAASQPSKLRKRNRNNPRSWNFQGRFARPFGVGSAPPFNYNNFRPRFLAGRRNNRRFGVRRGNFNRPAGQVFNFLSGVQNTDIDPTTLSKAESIAAQILAVQPPYRPQTAFGEFVAEARKASPVKKFGDIRKDWEAMPEKEKQEKLEANWKEFQVYKAKLKDYHKKVGEFEAELQILQGLQPLNRKDLPPRGFDIFWKEVEAKVIAEMPNASPFELEMKHRSLWKDLTKREKQLYIALSRIEAEKTSHELKLARLNNLVLSLKNDIEKDKKKAQEASVKAA